MWWHKMVRWVPTCLGPVVCFLWARFWLRFIYSKFAACLLLFWSKWEFGCKFMMTPFHGCAFILIVSVLPVQASCCTSGAVYFWGTLKEVYDNSLHLDWISLASSHITMSVWTSHCTSGAVYIRSKLEEHSKCCLPMYLASSYLTTMLFMVSTSSLTDTNFD